MKALNRTVRQIVFVAAVCCVATATLANNHYAPFHQDGVSSTDVDSFINEVVDKHGLERDFIVATLAKARKNETVLEAIARPWEAKPWHQYFPIFLTEKRINKGVEFWQSHQPILQRAEQEIGVPAHIIVAIIGVETYYGFYKGKYSVLDSLYSLGFHYPPRAPFFRKELGEYLKLISEEQWPAGQQKGSYAGAMGWGQFISSSYRHYAIDFDGDNKRDLLNNPVDAIGSVANYFKAHKWKTDEPVAFPVTIASDDAKSYLSKDLKITTQWSELASAGVQLMDTSIILEANAPAKLLAFEQSDRDEFWVGLHNFYVITRYNHSPLYAMAVYQLSQSIKAEMDAL